jgi:CBS domain-containing protein
MQVQDIMSKDVMCCTRDTSLTDVARMMKDCNCGEIPVAESTSSKRLVGVITDRDIVCRTLAVGKDPMEMAAGDCMSQPVVSVSPDASLEECSQKMQQHQIRRIPVVDNSGQCVGIVAQADLARQASTQHAGQFVKTLSQPKETGAAGKR